MNYFGSNKISKEEFLKINEDDVMFISNPGRMGDVSGYNIVVKNNNKLILYRIECLMKKNEYNNILNEDVINQFPIWYKELKNNNENNRKYHYLYMGFGNGLSIDNSIYNEYKPYLNTKIDEYLKENTEEEKESLKYAAIFNVWKSAIIEMSKDKKLKLY